jgi:hypothetical protein
VDQVSYLTIALAVTSMTVALWSIFAGLRLTENIAKSGLYPELLRHIGGVRFQLLMLMAFIARIALLWSKRKVAYVLALVALLIAVLVFREAYLWTEQGFQEIGNHAIQERPLAVLFGAPPGAVILYAIILFLGLACELAIFLVGSFRYFFRTR